MIVVEQAARIVFRAEYTRAELIELLTMHTDVPVPVLTAASDDELAATVLRASDYTYGSAAWDLRDRLANDAGDYDPDSIELNDWTARVR